MEILQFSKYQIIVLIMIKIDCSIGQMRKLNSPMTCAIKSTVVNIGTVKYKNKNKNTYDKNVYV
jgi:hypothetical protein